MVNDMSVLQRRNYFRKHKFSNDDVMPYLSAHVHLYNKLNPDKKTNGYQSYKDAKHPKLSDTLADIIVIMIEKIVNGRKFNRYTDEWKNDFRSNAYLLLTKYVHNFRPETKNAIGYLYMSIENAIIQELNAKKKLASRFVMCSLDAIDVGEIPAPEEYNPFF